MCGARIPMSEVADAPPLETAGGAKMTFFGRYAASCRASFEPATSHAENVSWRTCCTYRERTKASCKVRGAGRSLRRSAGRGYPPAEGLSRRSVGRGSMAAERGRRCANRAYPIWVYVKSPRSEIRGLIFESSQSASGTTPCLALSLTRGPAVARDGRIN